VQLDNGSLIFAPVDHRTVVRAEGSTAGRVEGQGPPSFRVKDADFVYSTSALLARELGVADEWIRGSTAAEGDVGRVVKEGRYSANGRNCAALRLHADGRVVLVERAGLSLSEREPKPDLPEPEPASGAWGGTVAAYAAFAAFNSRAYAALATAATPTCATERFVALQRVYGQVGFVTEYEETGGSYAKDPISVPAGVLYFKKPSDRESHLCWVCHELGGDALGEVFRDCACRGSGGFAHLACLIKNACTNATSDRAAPWKCCPTCKQGYVGSTQVALAHAHVDYVTEELPGEDPEFADIVSPSGMGYVNDCSPDEFLFAFSNLAQAKMEVLRDYEVVQSFP
jgi:hypothetical protein